MGRRRPGVVSLRRRVSSAFWEHVMMKRSAIGIGLRMGFAAGLCVAVGAMTPSAIGDAAPATKPAFTTADLNKVGVQYLLKAEAELIDKMKELAVLNTKMIAEQRARDKVNVQINKAKTVFAQADQARRAELEKLAKVTDAFQNNQIVAKIQTLEGHMTDAMKYKDEQEKELAKIGDESRTKYINGVVDAAAQADAIAAGYAALARDEELARKITAEKARLGPSPDFTQRYNLLKRWRAPIFAENIKLTFEGKVPMVDVTLNGSTVRKMVVDSGASYVCIPASLAKAMELVPAKEDPTVTLQLADGKLVEGKLTKLKSVRVGTFEVKDVECAVLPPELVAAEPLLGGSFLNAFTYKVDVGKEELHLSRIDDGKKK